MQEQLLVILREHPEGAQAVATWMPGTTACDAAGAAMSSDSTSQTRSFKRYVFRLSRYGQLTFAVVDYHPTVTSEWKTGVCFFDARWRKQGVCLAI